MKTVMKTLPALFIIVFGVMLRLIPHPANVAPITAMALFGGAYLNRKYALVVPLAALFLSDLFLGFHNTMLFVYGSFMISGILGLWLRNHRSAALVPAAALVCSLQFYLITNFGVWLVSGMYPHTISGLWNAYLLAIPFYRNTILGDMFYTALFFVSYSICVHYLQSRGKTLSSACNTK